MVTPQSVNLGLGQPVIDTPPELIEVVNLVMNTADLGYTTFQGIPELRVAIAAHVIGPGGSAENVCITVGTTEAFYAAMMTLLEPGDEVLIPNPGFISYQAVTQIAGANPQYYPVPASNGFKLSVDLIESRITDRTKVLVINSPNNPTGRVIDQRTLQQMGALADEHGFYILSEEVYRSIDFSDRATSAWGVGENVLIIDGISKIYAMTGWRPGWIIGEPELVKRITTMHHYMVACAPAIAQQVLLKLYADDQHIAKQMAFQEDVITIPGSAFGDQGEGYLRLSFAVT